MAHNDTGPARKRRRRSPTSSSCELCHSRPACVFCEPDQARLCWPCDARVHSANFLVARHGRSVLCSACQKPTPPITAGPRIEPRAEFCSTKCRLLQETAEDHQEGCPGGNQGGIACKDSDYVYRDEASCQSSVSAVHHHHRPLMQGKKLKCRAVRRRFVRLVMEEGTGDSEDQPDQPALIPPAASPPDDELMYVRQKKLVHEGTSVGQKRNDIQLIHQKHMVAQF